MLLYLGPRPAAVEVEPGEWFFDMWPGTTGVLDLRTIAERESHEVLTNHCIWSSSSPLSNPNLVLLGERGDRLTPGVRASLESEFAIGERIVSDGLVQGIGEVLNRHGSVTDETWSPIISNDRRWVEMWLAGRVMLQERFDPVKHPWVYEMEQQIYRAVKAQADDPASRMPADQHLKTLDYTRDKYRLKNDQALELLKAPEAPDQGFRPHGTDFDDDFNRSDEALEADANWNEPNGSSWEVLSNQAKVSSSGGYAYWQTPYAYETMESTLTWVSQTRISGGVTAGPAVKNENNSSRHMHYYIHDDNFGGNTYLIERTGGSSSAFASTTGTFTTLDVMRIRHAASKFDCFLNGVPHLAGMDTSHATHGHLTTGMYGSCSNGTVIVEDWSSTDSLVTPSPPLISRADDSANTIRGATRYTVRGAGTPGGGLVEVDLAGAQPASTGVLSLVKYLLAVAGAQPAPSGALSLIQYQIALAGNQPGAAGALSLIRYLVTLAGAQPASTGELSLVKYFLSLAGNQAAPAGTIAGALTIFASIAGNQGAPSGALSLVKYLISTAGAQGAPSGSLNLVRYLISLAGAQAAPSGTARSLEYVTLAGNQPASAGTIAFATAVLMYFDLLARYAPNLGVDAAFAIALDAAARRNKYLEGEASI